MASTIFYAGSAEYATLQNTFDVSGSPTDPDDVSCVITDPDGNQTTHTYNGASPADITKLSTGEYQLLVSCTVVGLWSYVWIGTGAASDVQPGTWTVQPVTQAQFYCSVEELKDRLKINDTADDMSLNAAVQAASRWIEGHCGRHFYQFTETRTYMPYNIWEQMLDDVVTISSFLTDDNGDGVYETVWTEGTDYQLLVGPEDFNQYATGEQRPFTRARVINYVGGGKFFPFVWPFSPLNRIEITGTWGWPQTPYAVRQAALQVSEDFYKLKDAPFGIAGVGDFGIVRVPKTNSTILGLLTPYVRPRGRVGV